MLLVCVFMYLAVCDLYQTVRTRRVVSTSPQGRHGLGVSRSGGRGLSAGQGRVAKSDSYQIKFDFSFPSGFVQQQVTQFPTHTRGLINSQWRMDVSLGEHQARHVPLQAAG